MNKEVYVVYFGGNAFESPIVYDTKEKALDFIKNYLKNIEEKGEYHVRYKSEGKDTIQYNLINNNGGVVLVNMSKEPIL